jgi:putative ABC transport system ATP-binding protein
MERLTVNDPTQRAAPTPEPRALLSLRGVAKIYGEGAARVRALRGIDLDVFAGDFMAILGPSGCGKSTAMNILGCLDIPTSGIYRIEGMPVEDLAQDVLASLRNSRFGFIFQGFNLLPRSSALANVELPLIYAGVKRHERARRSAQALAEVGLAGRERATPTQLSGGQQQRVAIARALVNHPPIILADEPTGNLDSATGAEIMQLLTRFNTERGMTIVMVTHDREIASYATRHLVFRDGRIVSDSAREEPRA